MLEDILESAFCDLLDSTYYRETTYYPSVSKSEIEKSHSDLLDETSDEECSTDTEWKESLLQKLLEVLHMTDTLVKAEVSFVNLQLILKQYIKEGLKREKSDINRRKSDEMKLDSDFFLLDKKGSLSLVFLTESKSFWDKATRLKMVHSFNYQVLDEVREGYFFQLKGSLLNYWNNYLPEDQCLVSIGSIFPEEISNQKYIKLSVLEKGLALGNECLFELKKMGYLKEPKVKEYIR